VSTSLLTYDNETIALPSRTNITVRAPDHLGDGVMALPAIKALSERYSLTIVGPKWITSLYQDTNAQFCNSLPTSKASTIVLFKPSFGSAWRARGHQNIIGINNGIRRYLLTHTKPEIGHRIEQYNSLATILRVQSETLPKFTTKMNDFPNIPTDFILCIIGTRSAQTVRWKYFSSLANASSKPIVFMGGPGDEQAVQTIGKGYRCLPTTLSLVEVAAVARKATKIVGIDSGLTHLAIAARNAAGIPATDNIIVYGSTSPDQTGPRNSTPIYNSRPKCWPCYQKKCAINSPCLQTSHYFVLQSLI
jgi:ADP-heptose:LPS heptosyltransferase